jgi:hypothetical protein
MCENHKVSNQWDRFVGSGPQRPPRVFLEKQPQAELNFAGCSGSE